MSFKIILHEFQDYTTCSSYKYYPSTGGVLQSVEKFIKVEDITSLLGVLGHYLFVSGWLSGSGTEATSALSPLHG